ncbi:MAG: trimeric autotransporter adhesin [Paraburkholderia sp.]|uniref:YadA-like family protein n=1 Tax=Paraburkholderia sp. TaxID=1926495 RepID=UPI002AFF9430|nr:YadA-like family protein [Paraburkholderia sp.]MEA3084963.1 trimeric autotransporter adhesin [Paraburkholderia sp.]
MLNKTYKNVWNRTTRTYVAASEVAKRRGAKSASASGVLLAAGAGLFGGLALPASAAGSIDQYIAVSTTLTEGSEPTSVDNSKVNAMAVGPNAVSNGANALAVGAKTLASLDGTTAVGSAAAALAVNATVIGAGASTSSDADNGVAIGYMAAAEGVNTLGLGARASAFGDDSIALGTGALTSSNAAKTIAIGSGASASAAGGIALGAGSKADRTNALSIGNSGLSRQIINVAAGTQNGDVVNVSQLKGALESIGGGATVDTDGTIRKPAYTIKGQTYSDVGAALSALVTSTAAASADAVQYDSTSHDTVTLGSTGTPVRITNVRAAALSADSLDAVNGSQLFATNAAVTQNTSDIAANTSSITNLDQRVTDNTTTITNLDARTTTIEGDVSNITNQITNGELGLVQQDQTSRNLTVAKDTDGTSIDFTGTAGARELTGVAAGTTDTSAANVGQLKPMVAALGGGAQINADGSLRGPTYHVQGSTQTTVGDALGSLDSGLTTLQQNMETGGIGIVTQDPVSRIINVGATTDGALINMAGLAGNRVVSGVASGAVNAASADAINGAQLYTHAASTAVALGGGSTVNPDGSVSAPSYSVGGTVVNNVGSAITNLDGRVTQNSSDIAGLQTTINNISGSVANAVQYDSSAHDKVTLGGTAANAPKVTLTNLKDGDLSATSTDAVTGAQLWNTNQQLGTLGQQLVNINQVVQNNAVTGNAFVAVNSTGNAAQAIGNGSVAIGGGAKASAPNSVAIGEGSVADLSNTVSVGSAGNERRITNVAAGQAPSDAVNLQQFQGGMSEMARNAYSCTASAIALTMVPEVDTGKNLAIGVGTAGYKGYQAVAVGLSARVTQSLKVKLGAGISSATTTVGAGAAYQW